MKQFFLLFLFSGMASSYTCLLRGAQSSTDLGPSYEEAIGQLPIREALPAGSFPLSQKFSNAISGVSP